MADEQLNSQVAGQIEWDQSDPTIKTSQVAGQIEYDISDPKMFISSIIGQVECLHTEDIPSVPKGISITVIT